MSRVRRIRVDTTLGEETALLWPSGASFLYKHVYQLTFRYKTERILLRTLCEKWVGLGTFWLLARQKSFMWWLCHSGPTTYAYTPGTNNVVSFKYTVNEYKQLLVHYLVLFLNQVAFQYRSISVICFWYFQNNSCTRMIPRLFSRSYLHTLADVLLT